MNREEEVRLLREILQELKAIKAILNGNQPRCWETYMEERIRMSDAETQQKQNAQEKH